MLVFVDIVLIESKTVKQSETHIKAVEKPRTPKLKAGNARSISEHSHDGN